MRLMHNAKHGSKPDSMILAVLETLDLILEVLPQKALLKLAQLLQVVLQELNLVRLLAQWVQD